MRPKSATGHSPHTHTQWDLHQPQVIHHTHTQWDLNQPQVIHHTHTMRPTSAIGHSPHTHNETYISHRSYTTHTQWDLHQPLVIHQANTMTSDCNCMHDDSLLTHHSVAMYTSLQQPSYSLVTGFIESSKKDEMTILDAGLEILHQRRIYKMTARSLTSSTTTTTTKLPFHYHWMKRKQKKN